MLGLTIRLPECMVDGHSMGPQRRLVEHLWISLRELVCLHHSHFCPISEEHMTFKQAYSEGMRDTRASTNDCLPVTEDNAHYAMFLFVLLYFDERCHQFKLNA